MSQALTTTLTPPLFGTFNFSKLFERRRAPRAPVQLRAEAEDGSGGFVVTNLSMTGMIGRAKTAHWPGSLIKVWFYVPLLNEPLRVWVKVLELMPHEKGVDHKLEFCYLTPKATFALYRLFDRTRHLWR
jgi:hypothetical protein